MNIIPLIILYIIKIGLKHRSCAKWLHQIARILINFYILRIDTYISQKKEKEKKKNRYIYIFWINMTNQVMKENSI